MELTAEYLESKGWVESDRHHWIFKQQFGGISYGVYVNQDKCISLFAEDAAGFTYFAHNIRTQERFDTLWNAITTQD